MGLIYTCVVLKRIFTKDAWRGQLSVLKILKLILIRKVDLLFFPRKTIQKKVSEGV